MSRCVSIETAGRELESILKQSSPGESVTLVDSSGSPIAILLSVSQAEGKLSSKKLSSAEWLARWDALSEKISKAWQGDKGAVETLSEMRR